MSQAAHQRVMVKLSGEVLGGKTGASLDQPMLKAVAADLVAARKLRATIGVVVGGGNFMRGATVSGTGLPRETGDAMGMLATVINALALEAAVTAAGGTARTLSAIAMPQICESYSRQRALQLLGDGHVVIFAGGTGNPYFTTDTTAVLRAAEMNCDAVLKATNVDGVYSADPKRDPKATRFEKLSHADAIARDLKVMDATAFALARENRMPIIVFSILDAGAITAVLSGKARATTVSSD